MLLDNQLLVRESNTKVSRMCFNAKNVSEFLVDLLGYRLTEIEYLAIDQLMSSVVPVPDTIPADFHRHLVVVDDQGNLEDWEEDEELPGDFRKLAVIMKGAYTRRTLIVAQFFLNSEEDPIDITFHRKLSNESLPLSLAEDLWSQQLQYITDGSVPNVMADLCPFNPAMAPAKNHGLPGYTLKIGEESFSVKSEEDLSSVLRLLLQHPLCASLTIFIHDVFTHLHTFPGEVVSSPVVSFYTDNRRLVYVGGDGTNNTRRLVYAGKFFPAYFTGLPGNVCLIRVGMFEPEVINILLVRN